jgi:hypothetical protein
MFKLAARLVWSIKATRSMLEQVKNTFIKPSVCCLESEWMKTHHDDFTGTDITGLVRKFVAIRILR